MPLLHGRDISADQVEWSVSREFPLIKFAGLANALVWATSRPTAASQVAFTERVLVKDNGIDGEWAIELADQEFAPGSLVCAGWNVLQYKQRDISNTNRKSIIDGLKRELKEAVKNVVEKSHREPDSYILFTNIHLSLTDKQSLQKAILKGYDRPVQIQIIGAAELAPILNNLPHLRSAFFATANFADWDLAWNRHKKAKPLTPPSVLVGRAADLTSSREAIDADSTRVLVISGPPGIGKTRLAFAATEHLPLETVFAIDPMATGISDLLALRTPQQSVTLIIEDPSYERAEDLIGAALESDGLKLVITVPTTEVSQVINFGRDPRIKTVPLQGLSEAESREMLGRLGVKLDYSIETWVVDQAGGNPSILIACADVGSNLRIEGATFLEQVGDALISKARSILSDRHVEMLKLLSVMTAVGYTGPAEEELTFLCQELGREIQPHDVLSEIKRLTSSGFARRVGSYVEVAPPIFANRMAELTLAGRAGAVTNLMARLSEPARTRLLRRLRLLQARVTNAFWDQMFGRGGPLESFASALRENELLRLVAPAVPDRAIRLIREGIAALTFEQRRQITGNARRGLLWSIDQLLFRKTSAEAALISVGLFAEAETETYANNATGVFAECFYPLHAQFPLPPEARINVLRDLLRTRNTREMKVVALNCADKALRRHGSYAARRSEGPEPLDAMPPMTYDEVFRYWEDLIQIAMTLAQDEDRDVRSKAAAAIPNLIADYLVQSLPEPGIRMFEALVPEVLAGRSQVQVADLAEALNIGRRGLRQGERQQEFQARIDQMIAALDQGSFRVRLMRWVGGWGMGEQRHDENGQAVFAGDLEIRELARDAAREPGNLDRETLNWLCTSSAKRASAFFYDLGRYDERHNWLAEIERLGTVEQGELPFALYMGGRGSVDANGIARRLDELAQDGAVRGAAIVGASGVLPANQEAVDRVRKLIVEGRVDPVLTERQLILGGWMRPLTANQGADLLQAIAGEDLRNAGAVIDFSAMWVHGQKALEGRIAEIAWRCLEAAPARSQAESWDFDIVAAELGRNDIDRAFRLLDGSLRQPADRDGWEPLDRHSGNRFWNVLWQADRQRALTILLNASGESAILAWRITWHLPDMLDQVGDRDTLIAFGTGDVKNGELLSSCITAGREGFWPIAVALVAKYPASTRIRQNIAFAAQHMNRVVAGPTSEHLEACARDAEGVLRDDTTPGVAKPFLRDLVERFKKAAKIERANEEDESVN